MKANNIPRRMLALMLTAALFISCGAFSAAASSDVTANPFALSNGSSFSDIGGDWTGIDFNFGLADIAATTVSLPPAEPIDPNSYIAKIIKDKDRANKAYGLFAANELLRPLFEKGGKALAKQFTEASTKLAKGMYKHYKDVDRIFGNTIVGFGREMKACAKTIARNQAIVKNTAKIAGKTLDVGFALYGFYDMYENPKVGYNSPFLELCGNSIRGMSNTATAIAPMPVALAFATADVILNSETLVKLANDSGIRFEVMDDAANISNQIFEDIFTNFFDWWYSDEMDEKEAQLAELQRRARGQTFQGNGVGVYKPNIYLYPTEETQVSVTFKRPELVTVSDPPYENGWVAAAMPDGTLDVQGIEYGYLFYESLTDPHDYQTDEGFMIPADKREEAFTSILSAYGLNETEIADFNEFWCEKLDEGCDYAMYPQLTETIDSTMPVNITPAPDSVLRIWFAFVKDGNAENEPDVQPLERNGFTAVEWGGFFL